MSDNRAEDEAPERQEPPAREPVFNLPPVILGLLAACVLVQVVRLVALSPDQDDAFLIDFAFIPLRYSGPYAIDVYALVSPVTYAFLHGGWLHLGVNMIWLAAFGSPLASRIGATRFAFFWVATSLAAALLHFIFNPFDAAPVVGASGAISGMMGAAARFGFQIDRGSGKPAFAGPVLSVAEVLRSRTAVVFVAVWMIVNVVTGLGFGMPSDIGRIAWQAHIGGFLAGFFAVSLFVPRWSHPEPELTAQDEDRPGPLA